MPKDEQLSSFKDGGEKAKEEDLNERTIRVLALWFDGDTRREWPLDVSPKDTLQDLEKRLQEELAQEDMSGLVICCEDADLGKTLEELGKDYGSKVRFAHKPTKPDSIAVLARWQDRESQEMLPVDVPPDCTVEFLEGELLKQVKGSRRYSRRYKNPRFSALIQGGPDTPLAVLGVKDRAEVHFQLEKDPPNLLIRWWDWFREHHARIETIVEVALFAFVFLQLRVIIGQSALTMDIARAAQTQAEVLMETLDILAGTLSPLEVFSTVDGQVEVVNGGDVPLFLDQAYITCPSGDKVHLITQSEERAVRLQGGESALMSVPSEFSVLQDVFWKKVTLTMQFRYSGQDQVGRWDCTIFPETREGELAVMVLVSKRQR